MEEKKYSMTNSQVINALSNISLQIILECAVLFFVEN